MGSVAEAADRLWLLYAVSLQLLVFLGAVAILDRLSRGITATFRAQLWTVALCGTLAVALSALVLPGVIAEIVPRGAAQPMLVFGAAQLGAVALAGGSAQELARDLGWLRWAVAAWAAGAGVVLARLAWGWMAMVRITRSAEPECDADWNELFAECARDLNVTGPVQLRRHAGVVTPLAWGILRPVILLPDAARNWTPEARRAVLLHELAHVRRRDCLVQLVGRIAFAAFWFHPAVWLATKRHEQLREEACDAAVLDAGVPRAAYAECLLRVSDLARRRGATGAVAVSVGMARRSRLRQRILAMIDDACIASRPSVLRTVTSSGFLAVLGLAAATVRLHPSVGVLRDAAAGDRWYTRMYAVATFTHPGADRADVEVARMLDRARQDSAPPVRHVASWADR